MIGPLGIKRYELCTIAECKLEADEHLALQPLPRSNYFPDPLGDLHPATAAIRVSKSIIREFDMELGYDKETFSSSGLLFSAFNASAPQSRFLAYVLPMLTKLHLNLDLRCNDLHSISETSFHERYVASTLSTAINVDCLHISMQSIEMLSTRSPQASFGDCRLPELATSFKLYQISRTYFCATSCWYQDPGRS